MHHTSVQGGPWEGGGGGGKPPRPNGRQNAGRKSISEKTLRKWSAIIGLHTYARTCVRARRNMCSVHARVSAQTRVPDTRTSVHERVYTDSHVVYVRAHMYLYWYEYRTSIGMHIVQVLARISYNY